MELRQLRCFAAVAKFGSFTAAATHMNLAQPSLWRQVKALEARLDVVLFERSGRGVKLSSAGALLLAQVDQVLAQAEKVVALSHELSRGNVGVLSVACAYPHIPRLLMPWIEGFRTDHPDIHIALHEVAGLPDTDQARCGDVDFVTSLYRGDDDLKGKQLGLARVVVVTPDNHPWRNNSCLSISDLSGIPVVIGPEQSLTRRLLDPVLLEEGIDLDIVHETANISTLMSLARAGIGVGIIGDDILREGSHSNWPILQSQVGPITVPIWIYWSSDRVLSQAATQFIGYLLAH